MPVGPFFAPLISLITGLAGILTNGIQTGIANHQQKDPDYQSQVGEAQAAGQSAYLNGTSQAAAQYNNEQWSSSFMNQIDTYKRAGLNPAAMLQQGAAVQYVSPPAGPSGSVTSTPIDPSSFLQLANMMPGSGDILSAQLDNQLKQERIKALQNDEMRKAARFDDELTNLRLRNDTLEQDYKEKVETYEARYQYLKNVIRSQDDKHELDDINKGIQKLLLQEKQAYSEYYEINAKIDSETKQEELELLKKRKEEVEKHIDLIQKDLDTYDERYQYWKQQVDKQLNNTSINEEIKDLLKGIDNPTLRTIATIFMYRIMNSSGSFSSGNFGFKF